MRRSILLVGAALVAVVATASASRADDSNDKSAPLGATIEKSAKDAGAAIEKGANDLGTAIKNGAEDAGTAIQQGAQQAGSQVQEHTAPAADSVKQGVQQVEPTVNQAAKDTGNFFERTTQGVRDGAANLYQKVHGYFSGS
jgi:hypothetical protein